MNATSRNRLRAWVLSAALLASLSALADDPPDKLLVGAWYGEFPPAPRTSVQRFLTTRHADGTFTLHARMYRDGKMVSELRNSGLWGASNGMYFTVTTEVNGSKTDARKPDVINAYLVQKIDGDDFEYVHVASGNRFRVRRVEAGSARLPE